MLLIEQIPDLETHHYVFILNLVDTKRTLGACIIPELFSSGLRLSSSCRKRRLKCSAVEQAILFVKQNLRLMIHKSGAMLKEAVS